MTPLNAIIHLCDKRKQQKLYPFSASYPDVQKLTGLSTAELGSELRELLNQDKIKWYRNVNQITYFVVVE